MRACSKCRENRGLNKWCSSHFIQVFGKWVCSEFFLRSGGGNGEAILKAKARLRKRTPPKTLEERGLFKRYEWIGKIELRKRWVREDLNRVFESYQVTKPLTIGDLIVLGIARKPKKGQMIWREIVFREESEK